MAGPYTGVGGLPPLAMATVPQTRRAPVPRALPALCPLSRTGPGAWPPRPGNGPFHPAEPQVEAMSPVRSGHPRGGVAGAAPSGVPTVPGR
jgi:hypothetical protein